MNRLDRPFRVRLVSMEGEVADGSVRVRAEVSVPRKAELAEVVFYRVDAEVARLRKGPFVVDVATHGVGPEDYVRVVASLRDGRELEDVKLLDAVRFSEDIDVRVVQLQVLVTDRSGAPVSGGRLFQVTSGAQVSRVFAQIENELRQQYVLTYHTDLPPETAGLPVVKVLAARGKSQTTTRAALFRQLYVAKSRNIPDISPIWRLDLAKNGSLSIAEHFYHGLLGKGLKVKTALPLDLGD